MTETTTPRVPLSPAPTRVLVADDQRLIRTAITCMLSSLGYATEAVCNGRDAVEAASRSAFDFFLLDVQMPFMDGLEAARLLRQGFVNGQTPRIVAFSAEAIGPELYPNSGIDAFLLKPVRLADLARVLASLAPSREGPGSGDQDGRRQSPLDPDNASHVVSP